MKRAIRADWLLRQANELGYRAGGVGQPRNINLRRAVSSAYYAVFHGIVLTGTDELLPDVTLEERHRLARSFSHNNLPPRLSVRRQAEQRARRGPHHRHQRGGQRLAG